ncbi:MAG: CRISPR-associated endonuclease Cas2 [Thermotogae bacterium]|nr:MAG: CRISPR-associated endonuclease Cas2 [Thermotogota bacterium]
MRIIVVYDVEEKRVQKVLKFLRRYLNWVQNSVFEGEITYTELKEIKQGLKKIIKTDTDSVVFYKLKDSPFEKEVLGIEKSNVTNLY